MLVFLPLVHLLEERLDGVFHWNYVPFSFLSFLSFSLCILSEFHPIPSVFFPSIHASILWGALADAKGRKPILVAVTLMYGLASASFGFSVHIGMAFVTRVLMGFFDGMWTIKEL